MSTSLPVVIPDLEIITVRILNFPKKIVFKAWSDPELLKVWWGPNGFTNTFEIFDFKPGGRWKFVMHGPEKGHYQNECEFIAIDTPDFIFWKRHSQPLFKVCAVFEVVEIEKTKVTFRMIFDTTEERDKLKPFVVDKNEENFDRLEDLLNSNL